MQDRLKLRFWDNEIKKMRYGDIYLASNGQTFVIGKCNDKGIPQLFDIDNVITMQCTGLKDNNGELIFEGDIIENDNGGSVVEWDNEFAHFKANGKLCASKSFSSSRIITTNELVIGGLSVIGNIYENPELLDEVQK